MSKFFPSGENIELSLPLNAAYISAARLTASSIANRMGFSIDEIEDIKSAVSEACIFFINHAAANGTAFKVSFQVNKDKLEFKISCDAVIEPYDASDEMSLLMIKSLMDKIDINKQGDSGGGMIVMVKEHKPDFLS